MNSILSQALVLHHSALLSANQPNLSSVVLLHGLLGSARNFNSFARLLHQKLDFAYNIIAVDLPLHGRSYALGNAPSELLNYSSLASDVHHTLDYLGIEKAHVVGHSMGGKVAAIMALSQPPRVQSLAVLDISPVRYEPQDFAMVSSLIQRLHSLDIESKKIADRAAAEKLLREAAGDTPELLPFLLSNLQPSSSSADCYVWKFDLNTISASLETLLDFPAPLPSRNTDAYNGSLLLLKASKSAFVLSKHMSDIQAIFPNYSIVSVKDCGHWIHAEKPLEASEILSSYIKLMDKNNLQSPQ